VARADPALRVAIEWPPCGSTRLALAASQGCATRYHLTAAQRQRGLRQ